MDVLLDTSILGRLTNPKEPDYAVARDACDRLVFNGDELFITPQNIVEFRAFATRPTNVNGLGYTGDEAEVAILGFEQLFRLLPETPDIFPNWKTIVAQSQVMGKHVHDARLVAVAVSAGVDAILTFNTAHFQRLCAARGLQLLDPRAV
jgi:predicted nucleic acid-binding protein